MSTTNSTAFFKDANTVFADFLSRIDKLAPSSQPPASDAKRDCPADTSINSPSRDDPIVPRSGPFRTPRTPKKPYSRHQDNRTVPQLELLKQMGRRVRDVARDIEHIAQSYDRFGHEGGKTPSLGGDGVNRKNPGPGMVLMCHVARGGENAIDSSLEGCAYNGANLDTITRTWTVMPHDPSLRHLFINRPLPKPSDLGQDGVNRKNPGPEGKDTSVIDYIQPALEAAAVGAVVGSFARDELVPQHVRDEQTKAAKAYDDKIMKDTEFVVENMRGHKPESGSPTARVEYLNRELDRLDRLREFAEKLDPQLAKDIGTEKYSLSTYWLQAIQDESREQEFLDHIDRVNREILDRNTHPAMTEHAVDAFGSLLKSGMEMIGQGWYAGIEAVSRLAKVLDDAGKGLGKAALIPEVMVNTDKGPTPNPEYFPKAAAAAAIANITELEKLVPEKRKRDDSLYITKEPWREAPIPKRTRSEDPGRSPPSDPVPGPVEPHYDDAADGASSSNRKPEEYADLELLKCELQTRLKGHKRCIKLSKGRILEVAKLTDGERVKYLANFSEQDKHYVRLAVAIKDPHSSVAVKSNLLDDINKVIYILEHPILGRVRSEGKQLILYYTNPNSGAKKTVLGTNLIEMMDDIASNLTLGGMRNKALFDLTISGNVELNPGPSFSTGNGAELSTSDMIDDKPRTSVPLNPSTINAFIADHGLSSVAPDYKADLLYGGRSLNELDTGRSHSVSIVIPEIVFTIVAADTLEGGLNTPLTQAYFNATTQVFSQQLAANQNGQIYMAKALHRTTDMLPDTTINVKTTLTQERIENRVTQSKTTWEGYSYNGTDLDTVFKLCNNGARVGINMTVKTNIEQLAMKMFWYMFAFNLSEENALAAMNVTAFCGYVELESGLTLNYGQTNAQSTAPFPYHATKPRVAFVQSVNDLSTIVHQVGGLPDTGKQEVLFVPGQDTAFILSIVMAMAPYPICTPNYGVTAYTPTNLDGFDMQLMPVCMTNCTQLDWDLLVIVVGKNTRIGNGGITKADGTNITTGQSFDLSDLYVMGGLYPGRLTPEFMLNSYNLLATKMCSGFGLSDQWEVGIQKGMSTSCQYLRPLTNAGSQINISSVGPSIPANTIVTNRLAQIGNNTTADNIRFMAMKIPFWPVGASAYATQHDWDWENDHHVDTHFQDYRFPKFNHPAIGTAGLSLIFAGFGEWNMAQDNHTYYFPSRPTIVTILACRNIVMDAEFVFQDLGLSIGHLDWEYAREVTTTSDQRQDCNFLSGTDQVTSNWGSMVDRKQGRGTPWALSFMWENTYMPCTNMVNRPLGWCCTPSSDQAVVIDVTYNRVGLPALLDNNFRSVLATIQTIYTTVFKQGWKLIGHDALPLVMATPRVHGGGWIAEVGSIPLPAHSKELIPYYSDNAKDIYSYDWQEKISPYVDERVIYNIMLTMLTRTITDFGYYDDGGHIQQLNLWPVTITDVHDNSATGIKGRLSPCFARIYSSRPIMWFMTTDKIRFMANTDRPYLGFDYSGMIQAQMPSIYSQDTSAKVKNLKARFMNNTGIPVKRARESGDPESGEPGAKKPSIESKNEMHSGAETRVPTTLI